MSTSGDDEALQGVANVEEVILNVGLGVEEETPGEGDSLNDVLDSENKSEVESLSSDAQAALRATMEAIEAGKVDASLESIVVPKMGQLLKLNGTNVIISGGQPNESWTGLMRPTGSYRSPLQLRTLNKVSTKEYKLRCEKIPNLTIEKETNLVLAGDILKRHFEENGIDTPTYLPDPSQKGNTLCVLSDHAKLTKEEAILLSKKVSQSFDFLDWENNGAATAVLFNSLDPKLYEKLIKQREADDTFVITWFRLVDLLYPHSISTFEGYKADLRKRRPTDYSGQDIEELCSDFENDYKKLSYYYDHELTMVMLETIMTAGGDSNEDFKSELRPLKKRLDKGLMAIRFLDSTSKERYLDKEGLSVAKVLEECESQYRYLKSRNKWYPALGVTDTSAAPKSFVAQAEDDQSMKAAEVMILVSNLQSMNSSRKKKGNCNYCGKPGHWKDDCVLLKLKKQKEKSLNNTNTSSQKKKSWRRTPPAPGSSETIHKEGRTYYWCGKCKRWTESHGTSEHINGYKKANKTDNSTNKEANAALSIDASVWNCSATSLDIKSKMEELFWILVGFVFLGHFFEQMFKIFSVVIPIIKIFKRDLFFLSLGPIVYWLCYMGTKWLISLKIPKKKVKKYSRRIRRKYEQQVWKEYFSQRKRSTKFRRYPRVGPVRRRGIYGLREHAPTVLERKVMRMLRDLRFELRGTRHSMEPAPSRPVHRRTRRNRNNCRRNNRGNPMSMNSTVGRQHQGPILCMATNEEAPIDNSRKVSSNFHWLLKAALQAPRRLINSIKGNSPFQVIWDSGASHCVTYDPKDFISEIKDPGTLRRVKGINSGLEVTGIGTVQWTILDEKGDLRHLKLPALLVPKCERRLLSTSVLLQHYQGEHLIQHSSFMRLSGNPLVDNRSSVLVPYDKRSGLLKATMYRLPEVKSAIACLGQTISTVHKENLNLSEAEKELLKWHYRLGHLSFRRIQSLLRSGVFSHSESSRILHSSACRLRHPPKCAACMYGKQSARPIPNRSNTIVRDVGGGILSGDLHPGQRTSIDHFICSTRGRRLDSAGRTKEEDMFSGGIIFVDHASDFVFVDFCTSPNTTDSILSKEKYEATCRDVGVIPQAYLSDNGRAFTSKEFSFALSNLHQSSSFSGVGAHHSNGKAENTIKRIMAIARTMMIHSAIHWPDVADSSLWPLAVEYAVYLHNHVPQVSTGLAPNDVFTKTRNPTRRLLDLRVWGSPTYVLDKVIADGKKLPRWKPRSTRRMFVGLSKRHSSKAPLVLNLESGYITPQFHVVHDDFFATVSSTPDLIPNFNSDVWKHLFGSATHYLSEDLDLESPNDQEIIEQARARRRQEGVASQLDLHKPPDALPVPPPPTTQPNDDFVLVDRPVRDESDHVLVDRPVSSNDIRESSGNSTPSSKHMLRPEGVGKHQQRKTSNSQELRGMTSRFIPHRASTPEGGSIRLDSQQINDVLPDSRQIVDNRTRNNSEDRNDSMENIQNNISDFNDSQGASTRPKRNSKPITRFSYEYERYYTLEAAFSPEEISTGILYLSTRGSSDDFTFDEVMARADKDLWIAAAIAEVEGLVKQDTWIEEDISCATSKILPGTWTFKLKRRPDGSIKKYKARYCVRGDLQEGNEETHAPVCDFTTVRIFFVFSLLLGWTTCTIDFVNAFVQAVLTSPVWIHLPRGFRSTKGKHTCLRLKKSLYGLRTAPRLWHEHLRGALLISLGFRASSFDPCLFYKKDMMAIVYVDDLGLAFSTESVLEEFLTDLKGLGFEFTREGTFSEFLGIDFVYDSVKRTVSMTQGGLIKKILATAGMTDCKPNKMPTCQVPLGNDDDGERMVENWSYASVVGMLLYLSTHTRPDVSFAVSQLARFTHTPKRSHAKAVKHLLRYLKGTDTQGITFQLPTAPLHTLKTLLLEDYVDSDFAGLYRVENPESSISAKSRTGYIIFLCGCPLIWKSQLQSSIALSTQEAEYTALSQSARTLLPIRDLIHELLTNVIHGPTLSVPEIACVAFEDNRGTLTLANSQRLSSRTKYYHVNSHWFWKHVKDGSFKVAGISSARQKADYLTKPLPLVAFAQNRFRVQGF